MELTGLHVSFLLLVIWAVHCYGRAYETESIIYNNTQQPYKENMFSPLVGPDYFFLVMLWQNSYPRRGSCQLVLPHNYFIVHGLWPQRLGRSIDCSRVPNTRPFISGQLPQIPGLVNQLNNIWPNLRDEPNECFWEHEYKSHGSCVFETTVEYFEVTVQIIGQIRDLSNLNGHLENHDIRPGTAYYFSDLQRRITAATGFRPRLQCYPSDRLYQIYFCAKPARVLESCPPTLSSNIGCDLRSKIRLP